MSERTGWPYGQEASNFSFERGFKSAVNLSMATPFLFSNNNFFFESKKYNRKSLKLSLGQVKNVLKVLKEYFVHDHSKKKVALG